MKNYRRDPAPLGVWVLACAFALYTVIMVVVLWDRSSDPLAVSILNTVAAIVATPVGGLIALTIFLAGGAERVSDRPALLEERSGEESS